MDYPSTDFPQMLSLVSSSLDGYNNPAGVATHIIATAFPTIGATVVKGGFNLSNIGYSSDAGQT